MQYKTHPDLQVLCRFYSTVPTIADPTTNQRSICAVFRLVETFRNGKAQTPMNAKNQLTRSSSTRFATRIKFDSPIFPQLDPPPGRIP